MQTPQQIPTETDVLIVGAGPVGAALANLCGRLGVRTLVIDKAPAITTHPRAIALDNEALRILQLAGLDENAFERIAIPEVRLHSPIFGQFARMNTSHLLDGHPMLITFFQPALEEALHAALATYPTVHVVRPAEWLSTTEDVSGCNVALRLADGTTHAVRTQYVVGADGASSPIRHSLEVGFEGSTYEEDWLIVDAFNVPKAIDHIEFLCDPKRPAPHMPAPGGRQRWEFMLHPGESREEFLKDAKVKELLAPWVDRDQVTVERTAVYRFHARVVDRFRVGRTLLVGDAAHVTPPFVGQGLVAGLRDVANLAWKLAWVVQKRADDRILDSYHTERQPHARAMIRLAQWMGKLIMPRSGLAAFVSHGIARLMTLTPGVRSLITDLKIKPQNKFGRGLFVPRGGASRFEHGNHLAQGRLQAADGGMLLSDDALGQHLQLVGIGVDPQTLLSPVQRSAWEALGGQTVTIAADAPGAWSDVDGTFTKPAQAGPWLIAVRPDKVVMADGAPTELDAIIRSVSTLLKGTPL